MIDPADFGSSLRRQRERRGVSLQHVADETKISASLLADLERGELARWPAGIFGRAFVRSYAEAVGLDPREALLGFMQLVPSGEDRSTRPAVVSDEPFLPGLGFREGRAAGRLGPDMPPGAIRLTLAEGDGPGMLVAGRRGRALAALAVDSVLLAAGAGMGVLLAGWSGWLPGLAAAAVLLVACASALIGTTPGRWLLPPPAARYRPPDRQSATLLAWRPPKPEPPEEAPVAQAPRERRQLGS